MKNLLEFILNRIVEHPDEIVVEESQSPEGVLIYTLHTHPDDIGKVIGKHGSVIHAIRTLVKVRALKENIRVSVQLAEE